MLWSGVQGSGVEWSCGVGLPLLPFDFIWCLLFLDGSSRACCSSSGYGRFASEAFHILAR